MTPEVVQLIVGQERVHVAVTGGEDFHFIVIGAEVFQVAVRGTVCARGADAGCLSFGACCIAAGVAVVRTGSGGSMQPESFSASVPAISSVVDLNNSFSRMTLTHNSMIGNF